MLTSTNGLAKAHCRDHQYGGHSSAKDDATDRVATRNGLTGLAEHGHAAYSGRHVQARQDIQRVAHSRECNRPKTSLRPPYPLNSLRVRTVGSPCASLLADSPEEILLPMFRQLGFQRITSAGHRDKALPGWVSAALAARSRQSPAG